ncbi:membrane-targeted effector domain-containing toxin [Pseudomonas sp. dw_612]|uniref:membrane-targeted effector domain-containing toxin n=1 Tax=Pseudomonas sp. dw_612 TaxID=2720080 RepID=UPI001BD4E29E|nr:membrane-targeted effector domain-containing toxin [Pseudomonas sp. dw_612]
MTATEHPSPAADLPNAADAQALKVLVPALVEACPDLYDMATTFAKRILTEHGIHDLEPDQVYWHRFHGSQSNDKTFTGWEHIEHPHDSMTLTQLVITRFTVHDQDNTDMLDNDCGFYSAGPEAGTYNETNEVRLFGSEVLKAFWAYNFVDHYKARVESFWNTQGKTFRTLAKCAFLAKALEDYEAGRLTADHLRTVINAAAGTVTWPATLNMLEEEHQPSSALRIRRLCVGGFVSTDILCIVDSDNRQIVYVPGELWGFHVFDSVVDLHWWILSAVHSTSGRQRFLSHFPAADHDIMEDTAQFDKKTEWLMAPFSAVDVMAHFFREPHIENVGLDSVLDLLFTAWKTNDHRLLEDQGEFIQQDPFTYLRDATHARMMSDATFMMTSNGELRKKLWIGYLNAFGRVFGPLAAVGWPVALAVVGAGLANVGLNIEQAVNGKTSVERKAGVTGAIFAAINTLFNAIFLKGGSVADIAEADGILASEEPIGQVLPEPIVQSDSPLITEGKISKPALEPIAAPPLEELVPERFLPSGEENFLISFKTEITEPTIEGTGISKGVIETLSGRRYIFMRVGTAKYHYRVRYVGQLQSWIIIDPANPWSLKRNIPVSLNEYSEWEPASQLGLKGGVGGKIFGLKLWGQTSEPLPPVDTPPTPYDLPETLRPGITPAADGTARFDILEHSVEAYECNLQLQADTNRFFAAPRLPARPTIPAISAAAPPKEILKNLLRGSRNLVIGEAPGSMASKQFLIENMPLLSKLKVRTLHLQHLLTEFHQADLDNFTRFGNMSRSLERYLREIDQVQGTDPSGQFTTLELVRAAQQNHIRVQALDCFASYQDAGRMGIKNTLQVKMGNYFARTVIDADQTARGTHQWVALVNQSQVGTLDGAAGLSEIEGAVGLRIEEAPVGKARGIEPDPGTSVDNRGTALPMRTDLRLQLETPEVVSNMRRADKLLTENGMFTLVNESGATLIVSRNRYGALIRTVIQKDLRDFFVDNRNWTQLYGQHYKNLNELREALIARGMKPVKMPVEGSLDVAEAAIVETPAATPEGAAGPRRLLTPATEYDVPISQRPAMKDWVLTTEQQRGQPPSANPGSDATLYTRKVLTLRTKLDADAKRLVGDFSMANTPTRPPIPTENASVPEFLEKVFNSEAAGLVVGESPDRIASSRFLIENMPEFKRLGVSDLFLPRLLNDFNQADLDAFFFSKTGDMPSDLENYLTTISADQQSPFTYLDVVKQARAHGIHVQATDCAASYANSTLKLVSVDEQRMNNYLTSRFIYADEGLRAGKWVVLTAPEGTNTFRNIAGLSEQHQAVGLRIEEVGPGQGQGVTLDPGTEVHRVIDENPLVPNAFRGRVDTLFADMYLPIETPPFVRTAAQRERLLPLAGDFYFERSAETTTLWHRSRAATGVVSTPVERLPDGSYTLNRPAWPDIHQKPYPHLRALADALYNRGMHGLGRIPE